MTQNSETINRGLINMPVSKKIFFSAQQKQSKPKPYHKQNQKANDRLEKKYWATRFAD